MPSERGSRDQPHGEREPALARPLRVVVVDDDPTTRSQLANCFEIDRRFTVVATAGNGREGVEVVAAHEPDLVTLEVSMPQMDGITAAAQISVQFPQVDLVMCSADRHRRDEALQAGATAWVDKPIDLHQLSAGLQTATGSRAPAGPPDEAAPLTPQPPAGNSFQPIFSLHQGRLLAVEAVTHVHDAATGHPVADLELPGLRTALDDSEPLPDGIGLSLNCSPETLCDPVFLELIEQHPGRRLIVTIDQRAIVDGPANLPRSVADLQRQGVLIAIDHTGTCPNDLRHIRRLAPDLIKLDISAPQHLHDDPDHSASPDHLARICHDAGYQLIVNGVERPDDLHHWRDLGADAAQGAYLGQPGPLPVRTSHPAITTSPPATRTDRP